jgi:hypothetical protein
MRIANNHPMHNGGWLYKEGAKPGVVVPVPVKEVHHINATAIMRQWSEKTDPDRVFEFSNSLGVSVWSLLDLGIAWSPQYNAWAFPMKDAHGSTIGIRLRSDTHKWAVTGSRAGLFFGKEKAAKMTCVCEGPTDASAAITMGLECVGRSSCQGQEQMLCERLRKSHRVLIISDNDDAGQRGAERLQAMLKCPSLIWFPPCKDLREFVGMGGTLPLLESLIKPMVWTVPKV